MSDKQQGQAPSGGQHPILTNPMDSAAGWGGGTLHEKDALILDVFPNEYTKLDDLERQIRSISIPNAKWGENFKREDVAFGIQKLRVQCILEGGKVETDAVVSKVEELKGEGNKKMVKSAEFVAYTKC